MKKRFTGIISLILSLLVSLTFLTGCNLVTTDSEREMNQVVATVSVNENFNDEILLSDVAMAYINGGYLNEQYYGYTTEQNINLLIENLISQRIVLQNALIELEADSTFAKNTDEEIYTPLRYLTGEDFIDAEYKAYDAFNAYIKTFAEAEDATYADGWAGELRTVPTGATNDVKEKTPGDKEAYIAKGVDVSDEKAFSDMIDSLKEGGLLGDKYETTEDPNDIEYFKSLKEDYYEEAIINIYEERLAKIARSQVTYAMLEGFYLDLYEGQVNFTNAEFVDKLSNATVDSPLLVGGYGSYGYVHNLLLGVNDEQEAEIKKIKEDNDNLSDADYALQRKLVLDATMAKDLRASWLFSNYDVKEENGKLYFTGDYTFAEDSANSLEFKGNFVKLKDADEEKQTPALYTATSVNSYNLKEFVTMMNAYIGGTITDNTAPYAIDSLTNSIYGAKNIAGAVEYEAKINELLFAFSTDSGSLNSYKGYVIKPEVEGTATEEYVKTFGDAGRILLSQGTGYVIVASDYGYHIMFYSELVSANSSYATLNGYLDTLNIDKGAYATWADYYDAMLNDYEAFEETENYLYKLASAKISTSISNYQNTIINSLINKYRYEEEGCVKIDKKVCESFYK